MIDALDWRYHRPGCQSCTKTQAFLAKHGIEDGELRSTGAAPIVGEEALAVLDGIDELWVAKGQKVLRFDLLAARPPDAELLELMLGRSGKLRAPTSRVGRRLLVGYNEDLLKQALL